MQQLPTTCQVTDTGNALKCTTGYATGKLCELWVISCWSFIEFHVGHSLKTTLRSRVGLMTPRICFIVPRVHHGFATRGPIAHLIRGVSINAVTNEYSHKESARGNPNNFGPQSGACPISRRTTLDQTASSARDSVSACSRDVRVPIVHWRYTQTAAVVCARKWSNRSKWGSGPAGSGSRSTVVATPVGRNSDGTGYTVPR